MEGFKAKFNTPKEKLENNLLLLGILIFTIGTFTLNSFISSFTIQVIYLFLAISMFILYYIVQNQTVIVYKLELMWFFFFIYFVVNILYHKTFTKIFIIDMIVFFTVFLFLLFVKLEIKYYKIAANTMLIIATIYALSSFFQYVNMDLYTRMILPFFTIREQESLIGLYQKGRYTGFTWQTAFISGFLVYGIAIIILFFKENKKKLIHGLTITALPLLFISLMLAGKRAHLLFMVSALLFTYFFSAGPSIKKVFMRFLKVLSGFTVLIIGGIVALRIYTPTSGLFGRINTTLERLISGKDITSGRMVLYEYALKLFNETPIIGIGWREFKELSIGLLRRDQGLDPHNIYIQALTELGFIGFVLFVIPVIYILIKTIKLLMNAESLFNYDLRWKALLQFSLFSQAFFLLYGMTGNLLTDHMYILMWAFSASITLSAMKYLKETPLYKFKIIKSRIKG